jgi:hypothetical protein
MAPRFTTGRHTIIFARKCRKRPLTPADSLVTVSNELSLPRNVRLSNKRPKNSPFSFIMGNHYLGNGFMTAPVKTLVF